MDGDFNAAITLAELIEQLQSLDIKLDRYKGDILSKKEFDNNVRETTVYMKENSKAMSKILSDLSKAHNELRKYHIELETTKNDLLQKMKTLFPCAPNKKLLKDVKIFKVVVINHNV